MNQQLSCVHAAGTVKATGMDHGDDPKDVTSTPGPGRWRNPLCLPSAAVLVALGAVGWGALLVWWAAT